MDFSPKRVGETEIYAVDFASLLGPGETILSASWSNSVIAELSNGTDDSPGSMILGQASVSGTTVSTKITGGVADVCYEPICTAVTTEQTLILPEPGAGRLMVRA